MEGIAQGMPLAAYFSQQQSSIGLLSSASPSRSFNFPEDVLTISPTAMALSWNQKEGVPTEGTGTTAPSGVSENNQVAKPQECQTCKKRKYKDVSDDSSVSFQTPTQLSPGDAEGLVRDHELQHVNHEQNRAAKEGRKIVAQSVVIHYEVCPECGRVFVAGGTTTTITQSEPKQKDRKHNSLFASAKGQINVYA